MGEEDPRRSDVAAPEVASPASKSRGGLLAGELRLALPLAGPALLVVLAIGLLPASIQAQADQGVVLVLVPLVAFFLAARPRSGQPSAGEGGWAHGLVLLLRSLFHLLLLSALALVSLNRLSMDFGAIERLLPYPEPLVAYSLAIALAHSTVLATASQLRGVGLLFGLALASGVLGLGSVLSPHVGQWSTWDGMVTRWVFVVVLAYSAAICWAVRAIGGEGLRRRMAWQSLAVVVLAPLLGVVGEVALPQIAEGSRTVDAVGPEGRRAMLLPSGSHWERSPTAMLVDDGDRRRMPSSATAFSSLGPGDSLVFGSLDKDGRMGIGVEFAGGASTDCSPRGVRKWTWRADGKAAIFLDGRKVTRADAEGCHAIGADVTAAGWHQGQLVVLRTDELSTDGGVNLLVDEPMVRLYSAGSATFVWTASGMDLHGRPLGATSLHRFTGDALVELQLAERPFTPQVVGEGICILRPRDQLPCWNADGSRVQTSDARGRWLWPVALTHVVNWDAGLIRDLQGQRSWKLPGWPGTDDYRTFTAWIDNERPGLPAVLPNGDVRWFSEDEVFDLDPED